MRDAVGREVLSSAGGPSPPFSSSSPSLMLLTEAEAALGEEGGEVLLKGQREVGEGERSRVGLRVGLPVGLCLGERACSIRPLLS